MAKHNLRTTEQTIDESGDQPLIVDLTQVVADTTEEGQTEEVTSEETTTTEVVVEQPAKKSAIDLSLYEQLSTKSAKIRKMAADGHKTADIARALNIRYQHARNVLADPLKRPQA